jgi:hypothetical protein
MGMPAVFIRSAEIHDLPIRIAVEDFALFGQAWEYTWGRVERLCDIPHRFPRCSSSTFSVGRASWGSRAWDSSAIHTATRVPSNVVNVKP